MTFPDGAEPQENTLWWSPNRHPDNTFAMEFDPWQSAPLHRTAPATYAGEATLPAETRTLDFVTVHAHDKNGSTLTLSSPLLHAGG